MPDAFLAGGSQQWNRAPNETIQQALPIMFYPLYQPKVSLASGRLIGVEALARKHDPLVGELLPGVFLPLATDAQIEAMTFTILRIALADQASWKARGHDLVLSINAPAWLLAAPQTLARLLECVERQGGDPSRLTIEVTEAENPADVPDFPKVAWRLREHGFGLAIDDFGTGYSSMLSLVSLPFSELKIDRAFVHGAADDDRRMAVLEASARLGRQLRMSVTAEGAEDDADLDAVSAAGCDVVQGYVVARPLRAARIHDWPVGTPSCRTRLGAIQQSAT